MSHKIIQRFIRGAVISTEMVEVDELGRQVGGVIAVEATMSDALKAAIAATDAAAITGQTDVIESAKDAVEADPNAKPTLVADLKAK